MTESTISPIIIMETTLDRAEESLSEESYRVLSVPSSLTPDDIIRQELSLSPVTRTRVHTGSRPCTLRTEYSLRCPSLENVFSRNVPLYQQGISNHVVLVLHKDETLEYDRPEDNPLSTFTFQPYISPVQDINHFDEMVKSEMVKSRLQQRPFRLQLVDKPYLQATLLYTDEDYELAKYVRLNYRALDRMSGRDCTVFVLERPPQAPLSETIKYWKKLLVFNTYVLWGGRGWTRTKPYDKAGAYVIARQIGILPDQLPCVVFFELTEDEDQKDLDRIVIPIQGDLPNFFRVLFSSIQKEDLNSEEIRNSYWSEEHRKKLADIKIKVMSLGTKISADEDTVVYNFGGQTVFLNQPTGDVHLDDFQNTTEKTPE